MIVFQQMLTFLIFMVIGYAARKTEKISAVGAKNLSWLVADVANPALIISSALKGNDISLSKILQLLVIGFVVYAAMTLISLLVPVVLRAPQDQAGVYRNATVFCNIGFMGFPLLESVFGSEAVLYGAIFLIPFNLLLYTYAIWNCESGNAVKNGFSPRRMLSSGVIACIIAVIICLTKPTLPLFLNSAITNAANLTAALSMINVGTFLVKTDLTVMVKDVRIWLFSLFHLLLLPLAGVALLRLFWHDTTLLAVMVVILGTPVANMVAILAEQYSENSQFSTGLVAITTLLSVATLPLVYLILGLQ